MNEEETRDAVIALRQAADAARQLTRVRRMSAEHTRWVVGVRRILANALGEASAYFQTFSAFPWSRVGTFVIGGPSDPQASMDPAGAIERLHQRAYEEQLDSARGLLLGAADELEEGLARPRPAQAREAAAEAAATVAPAIANELVRVINLAERKLRKVVREAPPDERTVQDRFEDLLIGADIPFSRETERIEYSSKTYSPDFTLRDIDLAVDIKLCARDGREKEIIAEINDDILAYQTAHRNLLFVVYDAGFIRDVDRFSDAFERHENVIVRVVKH